MSSSTVLSKIAATRPPPLKKWGQAGQGPLDTITSSWVYHPLVLPVDLDAVPFEDFEDFNFEDFDFEDFEDFEGFAMAFRLLS